jgi:pimeloyl-ACP methyl ester carboxylesterase
MKVKIFFLIALASSVSCSPIITLDSFLFDPEPVSQYLRAEDLEEYGARLIIPDSLIEPVVLSSMGNKIYVFLVRGDPDSASNNLVTVLYCHGKDANINKYWCRVEYLWEMGYNILIFDYQGYGMSKGEPSGEALFSDGEESLEYLLRKTDIDSSYIVFYGFSLGAFIAGYLAADIHHPAALILEAGPASVTALLHDSGLINLPGSYVAEADFDNERRVAHVNCPLLMMHGRLDDVASFDWHVPPVWDRAEEPKENLWIDHAGHSDIPEVLGPLYHQKMIDFVSRHVLN